MADDTTPVAPPAPDKAADKKAEDALKARAKRGEGERHDETVPGGRYKEGDQIVNANGEPIKE